MYLDTIQESLERIKKEYETPVGGMRELLVWVQNILEKELIDKEPEGYLRFEFHGNIIVYDCPTKESGHGYFWISNRSARMDYTYVISDTLSEHYGMSVSDTDVKLTVLDLKELSINFVTEFFQFKLYSSIACGDLDP